MNDDFDEKLRISFMILGIVIVQDFIHYGRTSRIGLMSFPYNFSTFNDEHLEMMLGINYLG